MEYTKLPLTYGEQADQLLRRGMTGDPNLIIERLQAVSYYRLSGYWYPFRESNPNKPDHPMDKFRAGTSFDQVWNRYVFDRRLRLHVLDAIERIEIAVRSQLAYHHALRYGPFAYADDQSSMPGCTREQWHDFLDSCRRVVNRSKDVFVRHFREKYGDSHSWLPVWMAVEIMTFGSVLTFHRGCHHHLRRDLAKPFGVHATVFDSWLLTLNTVRNICAHHGRLWNRELGVKPKIPARIAAWNAPIKVTGERMFGVLTVCKWCLDRIAPQSRWAERVRQLLSEFPDIPRLSMGFPADWATCTIWATPDSPRGAASP